MLKSWMLTIDIKNYDSGCQKLIADLALALLVSVQQLEAAAAAHLFEWAKKASFSSNSIYGSWNVLYYFQYFKNREGSWM